MKKEIEENGKSCLYPISGNGLEGLALEWIINSLKQGGRAFIMFQMDYYLDLQIINYESIF